MLPHHNQMSRILLPKMVEKGGGVIVNLSSAGSFQPIAEFSVYSASKVRKKRSNYYNKHFCINAIFARYLLIIFLLG